MLLVAFGLLIVSLILTASFISLVFIFIGFATLCYFIKKNYKRFLLGISLPGPWAFPLLGNAQMIGKMKPEFIFLIFTELREKFGASYRLWLGPQLWVFLHTAQETHDALHDQTLLKADTFNQLNVLIGNGLLISHGKFWQTHRRALAPAFHPNMLRSFAPAIAAHADQLVVKLASTGGRAVEVSDYLFPCLLDAIVETSMGKNLRTQDDEHSIYTDAFHKTSELLFKRMINPLLTSDWLFKRTALWRRLNASLNIIHTLMESVIRERQTYLLQKSVPVVTKDIGEHDLVAGAKQRLTLLDTLLTAQMDGRKLSFREVRDEVNTFVFAADSVYLQGVDTTTAAMSFVCYALAKHAAVQSRLCAEIAALNAEAVDEASRYSMETLNRLEYLDMFIKECLRFYTIVPTTGRQTTCETRIGGRRYCAGVTLWLNLYGLAHDASYFPQPYEFKPERFDRQLTQPVPYSYLPFSGGPHVCIGRKYSLLLMKVLTVKIVERFELTLSQPNEELVLQAQMVLKSMNGIHVKFLKRAKK